MPNKKKKKKKLRKTLAQRDGDAAAFRLYINSGGRFIMTKKERKAAAAEAAYARAISGIPRRG